MLLLLVVVGGGVGIALPPSSGHQEGVGAGLLEQVEFDPPRLTHPFPGGQRHEISRDQLNNVDTYQSQKQTEIKDGLTGSHVMIKDGLTGSHVMRKN